MPTWRLRNQRSLIIVACGLLLQLSGKACHVRQSRHLPMLGLPFVLFSTPVLPAPLSSCKISHRAKPPGLSRNPAPLCHRQDVVFRAQARQQDSGQSPVRDAQDTELATADQQAKQDLYAQLLDRQKSSNPSEVSTSQNVGNQQATPGPGQPSKGSTELIFRLERRGEGWGEEIFPHLFVEQRPLTSTAKRDRNRSTRPKPWTAKTLLTTPNLLKHSPPAAASLTTRPSPRPAPRNVCTAALSSSSSDEPAEHAVHAGQQEGSAEQFLLNECGIEKSKVDGIITAAVAWRVTPGGRQLIDRRRRSRIERNMLQCAEYLIKECGIEPGSRGVGQIFAKVPQIMLCKPSTNDRWDRRVVQLAAFMHRHGHCNVPEGWTEAPDLAKWVQRQRVARAQSALSEERLQVLYAMGFEFGEVAQLTGDWEAKFDQLIEWLLWQDQDDARKQGFSWLGFDWGRKGGLQARELALWVQLQREFRRRNLLGTDAIKRLEAIGFKWEPEPGGKLWQHKWMHQLGKLLYIVERNRKISAAVASQPTPCSHDPQTNQDSYPPQRDPQSLPSRSTPGGPQDLSMDIVTQRPVLRASGQSVSRGFPPPYPSRYSPQGSRVGPQGGQKQAVSKGANALQRQIAKRRAALASAHLEAGQGFWLAKQRWLWRRGRLSREQFLMLQLAGLEMDIDPPFQWKCLAHEAAHYLHGSQIHSDQEVTDSGASGAMPQGQAAAAASPSLPRAKGRPRKLAHQSEFEGQSMHHQQQAAQAHFSHQQALPSQSSKWQSDANSPPQMYTMAHTSSRSLAGPSSMLVQQPQLQFRQLYNSRPATASTRASSSANLGASSASLDEEEPPTSASRQRQQQAKSQAAAGAVCAATAVAASSGDGSLYACTPPGRPPGRRLAVVRWVLNQRALWREGQLTPLQMQYMTILGVTWLLSSKVVQMTEAAWLVQLQAFGEQLAAVGQQAAAQLTDWFLHQQGLFALGFLQPRRVQKLDELGVSWQPTRTDADILWDARLTQLLSFRREHGHVQVRAESTNDQSLSSWLGFQCKLLRKGLLSSARTAQLLALGVKPDDLN